MNKTKDLLLGLLSLYKKALSTQLTVEEIDRHILEAKQRLDQSFANSGVEDSDLKFYIEELYNLKNRINE